MTGFAIAPLVLFSAISSYASGKTIARHGVKLPIMTGLTIAACGYLSLLITQVDRPDYIYLVLPLIVVGIGSTFTMPAATLASLQGIASDRTGIASGTFNACRQLGSLLGVALFGSIVNSTEQFVFGLHIALWISSACCAITALLACVLIPSPTTHCNNESMQH